MSDNAGDHDPPAAEVHPEPPTEVDTSSSKDDNPGATKAGDRVDTITSPPKQAAGRTSPPPPSSEPVPTPAASGPDANNVPESLFLAGDDEEGLDPDTLANLAALSRLARDEGDEDEDGDGGAGGDNDFSTLMADSQHSMTREQMQEIVARLAQHKDDDGELDAEGEDDVDAEGEEEEQREEGREGKHNREASEDLREVDEEDRLKTERGDADSKPLKRKRKRNRTVL